MKPVLHLVQATDASASDLLALGMGASIRSYLRGFDHEFDVHYYTADSTDHSAELGVRHHPLGPGPRWPAPLRWALYNLRVMGAAGRMGGLVRCLGPNLPALGYLRWRGCRPLVVDFRYDWAATTRRHYRGWKRWLAGPVQRRGLRAADLVIATTPALARTAAGIARRVIRIPNFVDASVFQAREPRQPVVVYAGRLHWAKGIEILIRACAEVRRDHPAIELHLFGEGEEASSLRGLASRVLEGGARCHGSRPQEEVAAVLGAARVAVLPSLTSEGMPKFVLEAFACGTPVVATAVPGIRDLVEDRRTGLLVPPGDAPAMAEAVREVLTDADLWGRLSRNGREKSRWFGGQRLLRHQRRAMRILASGCSRRR